MRGVITSLLITQALVAGAESIDHIIRDLVRDGEDTQVLGGFLSALKNDVKAHAPLSRPMVPLCCVKKCNENYGSHGARKCILPFCLV